MIPLLPDWIGASAIDKWIDKSVSIEFTVGMFYIILDTKKCKILGIPF